tara:strand:- start:328 stop:714 length:387 start_codon:yes stop_codon:yes gene_type:complete
MKTSQMTSSKYLKQDDVGDGKLVTIKGFKRENVAPEGEDQEMKYLMLFNELDKPLVLNATNIQLAERACGSDDTDDWIGKSLVLFVDPNVSFGGKIVGGIRVRAPKIKPGTQPAPKPTVDPLDEDIPF